jgi:hypothetical protein
VPPAAACGQDLAGIQLGSDRQQRHCAAGADVIDHRQHVITRPLALHYENGLAVGNGDYVLLHGRFSGLGRPANWIVVDIVRLEDGVLAEHWDVIQDEATREQSRSGLPMFGDKFPG